MEMFLALCMARIPFAQREYLSLLFSDMQHYNATEGENWLQPMLLNYTRCGPDCPPEGCF